MARRTGSFVQPLVRTTAETALSVTRISGPKPATRPCAKFTTPVTVRSELERVTPAGLSNVTFLKVRGRLTVCDEVPANSTVFAVVVTVVSAYWFPSTFEPVRVTITVPVPTSGPVPLMTVDAVGVNVPSIVNVELAEKFDDAVTDIPD